MANSKSTRTPRAKFRVGQLCFFVFGPAAGWARANGEACLIVAPRQRVNVWSADLDGGNRRYQRGVLRYLVAWRGGEVWTAEATLRLPYDGAALSTWEEFERVTGLRIAAPPGRVRRVTTRRAGARQA